MLSPLRAAYLCKAPIKLISMSIQGLKQVIPLEHVKKVSPMDINVLWPTKEYHGQP